MNKILVGLFGLIVSMGVLMAEEGGTKGPKGPRPERPEREAKTSPHPEKTGEREANKETRDAKREDCKENREGKREGEIWSPR